MARGLRKETGMTLDLDTLTLSRSNHESRDEGMCFMEAVAWLAGEEHSDQPDCACPVIRQYMIPVNDGMPDSLRAGLLVPLLSPMVGSRRDVGDTMYRRAVHVAKATVARVVPVALSSAGFGRREDAYEIRGIYDLTPEDSLETYLAEIEAVCDFFGVPQQMSIEQTAFDICLGLTRSAVLLAVMGAHSLRVAQLSGQALDNASELGEAEETWSLAPQIVREMLEIT